MKREENLSEVISFRISKSLSNKLKRYGKENSDEFGRNLNTNKAARKILIESLLNDLVKVEETKNNEKRK